MNEFSEKQKMTQWWIWAILIGLAGYWIWDLIRQLSGIKALDITGLIVGLFITTTVMLIFYYLELETCYNEDGIRIKYSFLTNQLIKWDSIKSAEIITYSFVGYGVRVSLKYGMVYNAKGNKGLFMVKNNSEKLLIGTQQPEKVTEIITKYMKQEGKL
ncbi:hypothetical protein [Dyadobacter sp. NIV53]|uniref:hypothetical protein n=1 Tax=Dyadobacter sp. NIV53 TaxID=2861765 RepID=UPI001C8867F4|nr:hypothetical protein [Dyadobacter sp. NIV53]